MKKEKGVGSAQPDLGPSTARLSLSFAPEVGAEDGGEGHCLLQ
jgi:hypothetical protein